MGGDGYVNVIDCGESFTGVCLPANTSIKGFLKYTLCFLKISWNHHMAALEHDHSDDVSCAILHS